MFAVNFMPEIYSCIYLLYAIPNAVVEVNGVQSLSCYPVLFIKFVHPCIGTFSVQIEDELVAYQIILLSTSTPAKYCTYVNDAAKLAMSNAEIKEVDKRNLIV